MANDDRSAPGQWHDYSRQLGGAEDAVGAAIETLLMDGGTLLWQKYLERKAFSFAATAVTEAVVSQLKMCFVAHDKGEDVAGMEEWELEDEPEPGEVDSWARMHLPVRRPVRGEDAGAGSSSSKQAKHLAEKQRLQRRAAIEAKNKQSAKAAKAEKVEPRAAPIQEETVLDDEEERLRDQKFQEEARRRDKERKAKEAERLKDEERKAVVALHEEMARKAHTFDNDGKIIWIEEVKVDKLPKVTETFPFNIKKDARQLRTESGSTTRNAAAAPEGAANAAAAAGKKESRRTHRPQRNARKAKVEEGDSEFTDGFSKLQHGQPPILDTMNVQPGVTLESMGKKKAGADLAAGNPRQMSRKEYVTLAQQEVMDMEFHSDGGGPQKQGLEAGDSVEVMSKPEPSSDSGARGYPPGKDAAQEGAGPSASPQAPEASAAGGSTTHLPPLQPAGGQRGNASTQRPGASASQQSTGSGAGARDAEKTQGAPVQMAPPVRSLAARGRRFDAVGHLGRPPRYHMPLLGGPSGLSAPQPPLGATMGHGLIRNGSLKETYFFPAQASDLPGGMFRSASDVTLPSASRSEQASRKGIGKRSSKTGSREASQFTAGGSGEFDDDDPSSGRLRPETGLAYRNFRSSLFPNETSRA
uniref:Uncharacterized protein n=1 Tax=Alexandrium monilatum TaxID=311494 RepID=A0A7S4PTA3_9DINO